MVLYLLLLSWLLLPVELLVLLWLSLETWLGCLNFVFPLVKCPVRELAVV